MMPYPYPIQQFAISKFRLPCTPAVSAFAISSCHSHLQQHTVVVAEVVKGESMLDGRLAVERFTQRVFKLPSKDFFPQHMALLDALRSLLHPGHLQELADIQLAAMRHEADAVLPAAGEVRCAFHLLPEEHREGMMHPQC